MEENTPRHVEVANTILEQLGGRRFIAMTGAKNFTASREGLGALTMKLPRGRHFRVILDASDTYTLELFRVRRDRVQGFKRINLDEQDLVFAEDLEPIFEKMTGLYTRL